MQFKIVKTITFKYVTCVYWGLLMRFNIIKPKNLWPEYDIDHDLEKK